MTIRSCSTRRHSRSAAAICLLCGAGISFVYNIADLGIRLLHFSKNDLRPPAGATPEVVTGFWIGVYASPVLDGIALILCPVLIYGAIQMLRRRSYGFCRLTAILAIVPLSAFCCCFLTLPFGIWALVALNNPDNRAQFV